MNFTLQFLPISPDCPFEPKQLTRATLLFITRYLVSAMGVPDVHIQSSRRRGRALLIFSVLLVIADFIRIVVLPIDYRPVLTDAFEAGVCLIGVLACSFAAVRSSRLTRGLWVLTAAYLALIAVADFHDICDAIHFGGATLLSGLELVGWVSLLPLALIIVFPESEGGQVRWKWLPILDFAQVAVAIWLAHFCLIYLPHARSGYGWTTVGSPELVRSSLVAVGLLLRAAVDPVVRRRDFYWKIGGAYASIAMLRIILPPSYQMLFILVRPAALLAIGIFAAYWNDLPGNDVEVRRRPVSLRLALSLFAAATLMIVLLLADTVPAEFDKGIHLVVAVSALLFIARSYLAERERYASEHQLRESEREYRVLFENAIVPIVIFEPGSECILQANPAACELYEVPRDELIGMSYRDFTVDVARGQEQISELLRTGACRPYQTVHRTRTGSDIDVLASASVIQYRGQSAIQAFIRDITEAVRADRKLRESETLFRLMAENVSDVIWILDLEDGRFRYVSPSIERLLGYTAEEIMARDGKKVLADDSATIMARLLPQRIEEYKQDLRQVYTDEVQHPCRDGSAVWVEIASNYVMNEQTGHLEVHGVSRDISQRKRAEEELRLSQQKLRESTERFLTVAKCAPDVIFSMDSSGRFTYVSTNMERTYGYTPEEALKLNRRDVATPQQIPRCDSILKKEMELAASPQYDRSRVMTFESEELRKDGTTFWAEINASLTWSDEGKPIGAAGVVRDITERKRAEAEYEALRAQLSQAQKMESIGRLAGGIAHDFGNILSTIMLTTGVAAVRPGLDPQTQRTLDELQSQAGQAANLTQQLLMFSRRSAMSVKPLDLNNVVSNLIKMLGRLIGENISLRFEPLQEPATVEADAGMIEQVIMNLAVNSRDAMPTGGKLIMSIDSVQVKETHFKARSKAQAGRFVCLSVSDTGCGMDQETLKHIFEPFYTTKEPGKGTGLGLSTVHGIVGQHKGWVEVESEVGKGTIFRVFLPAAERSALDTEVSKKSMTLGGTETVLLIEDASKLREIISESLRLLGYRVIEAGNSQEAIKKWRENSEKIDLLLSDIVLPGQLSGLEVAEKFQASKPGLKVILSSSYSAEVVDDGRLSTGNMTYLRKPYRIEELSKAIRDCLDTDSCSAPPPKSP